MSLQKPLLLFALILCVTSATKTVFTFNRKINTCDARDLPLEEATSKVLWAYNNVKPSGESTIAKHTDNGIKSVRFFIDDDDTIPEDVVGSIDIVVPNIPIRFDDPDFGGTTNYWCQPFKVELGNKLHVVRYDPIIDPRNVKQIHHILLYRCPTLSESDLAYSGGCYMSDTPQAIRQCNGGENVGGWAVGGAAFELPADVGAPLEGGTTYFLMEVHYDNPTQLQITDSSGLRLWYTDVLRPKEAGVLTIGYVTSSSFWIPPGQQAFTLSAWSPSTCSQQYFPPEGLNVIAVQLHAHTIAAAMSFRHYRNGVELKPILDEPYYDFNYQEQTPVNVTLFPGDTLRVDCTYNSMSRIGNTYLGLSTQEEMCVGFMTYYPKLPGGSWFTASYNHPAGGFAGQCGQTPFGGYVPPTFAPYVPPPCNRVAPDPNSLIPRLVDNPLHGKSYDRAEYMDPQKKYKLYWTVDRTNLVIHGAVEVETTGWIGFGISRFGMEGADVFIGWIGDDGVPVLLDRFAEMKALPSVDPLQDYYDVTAGELQPSSESSFPRWAVYTVGVVSGVLLVVAASAIFLFIRSRRKTAYSSLKESEPIYTKQSDVPL